MKRLPVFLDDIPPARPAWHWAALAAIVHASLGLGLLALERMIPADRYGLRALLRLDTTGLALSSALVGALVWLLARLAESRLRDDARVRERLFEIIDCLPDPAAVRDLQGRYVLWNQAAEAYYGITQAHVTGKQPHELFPQALAEALSHADRRVLASGSPLLNKIMLPPIYGRSARIAQLRVAPIHSADGAGKLRGVVSILSDITEAEQNAELQRRQEARLALALQACGAGLWDWDLEPDTVTYSLAFDQMLHYTGTEIGQDFVLRDRLHPGDRDAVLADVRASLTTGSPFSREYRLLCFDNQYRRFHGRGELLTDVWGRRHFTGLLSPLDPAQKSKPPSHVHPADPQRPLRSHL